MNLSKQINMTDLVRSIHETMMHRTETYITISMDDAYDYNILGDDVDPDDLYEELKSYLEKQSLFIGSNAFEDHLSDMLARMVFGSNMIESAGGGLETTLKLCRAIFQGQTEGTSEIQEGDADYEALKNDLVQKGVPHDTDAVLRSHCEIVQHAKAAVYIMDEVYVNGKDISEETILQTHRILTHGLDTEQGTAWAEYSGVYRQCDVSAGLHQFLDPRLVPGAMKAMIRSLNQDLQDATEFREINPVALAAKYSHTFVNIHPFADGNGRVCRLILNAILLKYSGIVVCIGEDEPDRENYMEVMVAGSMAEASAHEEDMDGLDEHHKPKYYKGLASFTLQHACDSIRSLCDLLNEG
ncbi:hypothetical protein AK830_g9390 [Neonectria ditissima]|uniref:Fido domain-containing protein n=1 Tax=Neonectria ditissima TaxID=78410 RepID=A0A0P7B9Y9_9HYPO|nr:hypothetical protein AK830_g9390 [Neonectria ditissima]